MPSFQGANKSARCCASGRSQQATCLLWSRNRLYFPRAHRTRRRFNPAKVRRGHPVPHGGDTQRPLPPVGAWGSSPVAPAAERTSRTTGDSRSCRGCSSTSSQSRGSTRRPRPRPLGCRGLYSTTAGPRAWEYKTVCPQPRMGSSPDASTAAGVDLLPENQMTRSLRSRPIKGRSPLLRTVPSLCLASVLLASRGCRLCRSLCIDSTSSTQAR